MNHFKTYFTVFLFSFSIAHAIGKQPKKAIIIGATSGMGREVAKLLSKEGYEVGLAGRRLPLLESLQKEIIGKSFIKQLDVTSSDAQEKLSELIQEMGGMDLILISISSYLDNRNDTPNGEKNYNPKLAWKEKERTLNVDLKGFIALAEVAFDFFKAQNHGHFVGISSSSGLNGFASTPVYSGAKACLSTYMQGMRNMFARDGFDIQVTDVIPGYVAVEHSPLGEDPNAFWEIPCEQAGRDILAGIKSKSNIVYVPARTRLLALLKFMPEFIYHKFFNWL